MIKFIARNCKNICFIYIYGTNGSISKKFRIHRIYQVFIRKISLSEKFKIFFFENSANFIIKRTSKICHSILPKLRATRSHIASNFALKLIKINWELWDWDQMSNWVQRQCHMKKRMSEKSTFIKFNYPLSA